MDFGKPERRWKVLQFPIALYDANVVLDPLDDEEILILGGNPGIRICYTFNVSTHKYWSLDKFPSFSAQSNPNINDATINPGNNHVRVIPAGHEGTCAQTIVPITIPKKLDDYWQAKSKYILKKAENQRKRNETNNIDDPQMDRFLDQVNQLKLVLSNDSDSDSNSNDELNNKKHKKHKNTGYEYDSDLELGYCGRDYHGSNNDDRKHASSMSIENNTLDLGLSPPINSLSENKNNNNENETENENRIDDKDNELVTRILSLNGDGYCFYQFDLKLNEWQFYPMSVKQEYFLFRTYMCHGKGCRALSVHTKNGDYLIVTGGNARYLPTTVFDRYKEQLRATISETKRQFEEIKKKLKTMETKIIQERIKLQKLQENSNKKTERNDNSDNDNKDDNSDNNNDTAFKPPVMHTVSKIEKRKQKFDVYIQRNHFESPNMANDEILDNNNNNHHIFDLANVANIEEEQAIDARIGFGGRRGQRQRSISRSLSRSSASRSSSEDTSDSSSRAAIVQRVARVARVPRVPRVPRPRGRPRILIRRNNNNNNNNNNDNNNNNNNNNNNDNIVGIERFAHLRRQSSDYEEEAIYLTTQEKKFLKKEMKLYFYIDSNHPSYQYLNEIHSMLEIVLSKYEYRSMFGKYINGNNNKKKNNDNNKSIEIKESENEAIKKENKRGVSAFNHFLGTKWPRYASNYRQERTFTVYNLRNFTELLNFDLPQLKRYHAFVEIINPSEKILRQFNDFDENFNHPNSNSSNNDDSKENKVELSSIGKKKKKKKRKSRRSRGRLSDVINNDIVNEMNEIDEDEQMRQAIALSMQEVNAIAQEMQSIAQEMTEKKEEKDEKDEKENDKVDTVITSSKNKIEGDEDDDENDENQPISPWLLQESCENRINSWNKIDDYFKEKHENVCKHFNENVKYFLIFGGSTRGPQSYIYRINLLTLNHVLKPFTHSPNTYKGGFSDKIMHQFGYTTIDDIFLISFGYQQTRTVWGSMIFVLNMQSMEINDISSVYSWSSLDKSQRDSTVDIGNNRRRARRLRQDSTPFSTFYENGFKTITKNVTKESEKEILKRLYNLFKLTRQRDRGAILLPKPMGRCSAVYIKRLRKRQNMGDKWNRLYHGNPMIDYIEEIHIIGGKTSLDMECDTHLIIQVIDLLPYSLLKDLWMNRGYTQGEFEQMLEEMLTYELQEYFDEIRNIATMENEKKVSSKNENVGIVQSYKDYAMSWINWVNPWKN